MKGSEIRIKFLQYFEGKGHKVLPGSSLVPQDPTVLLTLAGMLQFKPIFLGQEKPQHKRATTVQKCLRTIDVEQVGHTLRHHTFFEMLGNFSFGDYFKSEAIQYAWDFLVNVLGVPADKLLAAVYEKDDEAYRLWQEMIGLPETRIFRLDEENNFWAVGPTGPCGPCSEIYYDLGLEQGCGKSDCAPGCDCDRFLEVWNLVFIQYNRNEKGELIPLKNKGIDTGMGLERIASVLQGVASNFETDLFVSLINKVKTLTSETNTTSLRIIADHARAVTHLIADGVMPENTGRGYVLRRLIRRAVRHGKLLGIKGAFLHSLAAEVIVEMKDAYPNLCPQDKTIIAVIKTEEEHFLMTLNQGLELLKELLAKKTDKLIDGKTAFKLHDTFGFPIDLTREIADESGFKVDQAGFAQEMEQQRERARSAGISKKTKVSLNLEKFSATKFVGYDKTHEKTKVAAVFPEAKIVVVEKSPFYGESGGQVGDTGLFKFDSKEVRVVNTLVDAKGTLLHKVDSLEGLKEKQKVELVIDEAKRSATEAHHTATHLLHKALREVLGNHVKQAGSYVGPDKLRFDFSHFAALKPDQLEAVEDIVNKKIAEKIKVETMQKSYQDALKMGAMALFGEKYGDKVRVLKVGDFSLELCGGTHAKNTSELLFFKVLTEAALGAGVRRIEAVAGQAAKVGIIYRAKAMRDENEQMIKKYRQLQAQVELWGGQKFTETGIFQIEITELDRLGHAVDEHDIVNVRKFLEHLAGRVDWLKERVAKAEKEILLLKKKHASHEADDYVKDLIPVGQVKILLKDFNEYSMEMLRSISDSVQSQAKSCVIVLVSVFPNNLRFLITVTPDLIKLGYSAKKIADVFGPVVDGKGGGRDNKVEGGGRDATKLKEAYDKILSLLNK